MKASISEVVFGQLGDGSNVKKYTLRNAKGSEANFLNLGASWVGFKRAQDNDSLVLGCETLDAFLNQHAFIGGTIGRYANRIGQGRFDLNGEPVQVEVNLPPHHLHGGKDGFSTKIWQSNIQLLDDTIPTLTFTYFSPEGEGGFPGNVETTVTITLTENDTVRFSYEATTDAPTVFNLTNHAYFNLDGQHSGSLENHEFKINSTQFLDADETALPSGDIVDAAATPLDFSQWKSVYEDLQTLSHERLQRAEGFDHCFCFDNHKELTPLASARFSEKGIDLTCHSDLPGMQFYTGNFLGGSPINETNHFKTHSAFCFEPGYWPDSPNHPHFPDCTIDEDNGYSAIIEYTFNSLEE
jgi:aldose 1-epimerase